MFAKAIRAMRRVNARKRDVTRNARQNRLASFYAEEKARARARAEAEAAAADMDDAGLSLVFVPCRCNPDSVINLPCCC